ncbi:E3 ubiquitin-protein ligase CHFR isoform X4 [Pocillopora verrucosa]|uniref:E3 ubiquitin-protein ligase CHFR isoform X4 n=1 Tax=Pocillopora verrucosa TaxID=203993 RepID=UPI00333EB37E
MASKFEEGRHWAQVIFTHDSKPPVLIDKEQITLGRKEDCDISFPGCKFVSGHHCTITRDPGGTVWLQDFSTNGSLLSGKKIDKEKKIQINHNDQVQIVHRKDHPGSDIAFVFQDLKVLKEEAELLDNTLEYDNDTEEDVCEDEDVKPSEAAFVSQKRSHSEAGDTDEGPVSKRKHQESEEGASSSKKPELLPHNSIADTLLCSICQDIFHDCVSLQPCIHSFCAACYSQWMDRSNECPTCRKKVERISKNHIINNLVEAFLKEHPERRRTEEELREMDSNNKITEDMLRPKHIRGLFASSSFGEDDDDGESDVSSASGVDDSSESDDPDRIRGATFMPSSFGGLFEFSSLIRSVPTNCRLCPGYISPTTLTAMASTASEGASTSVTPPDYTCTPDQIHILCQCCLQPMPHRWPDSMTASIPAQKCSVCQKAFCHLLWGCHGSGCLGCLNKFKDFNIGDNTFLVIINNNPYESKILKDYLTEQNICEKDLLQKCVLKLDSEEYTTVVDVRQKSIGDQVWFRLAQDAASHDINSESVLCYRCALRNFKELAYQFRRDIPMDQLPETVHRRADCYWGKHCRTQRTKPLHASRFNHICEQTRFT